jgi:predicted dithiol-disulfide oxidoreductase (DUF899 family)
MSETKFPNETLEYRRLRDQLLAAEIENKEARERIATLRRQLPLGGRVKEDYVFREGPADLRDNDPGSMFETRLSSLFAGGRNELIIDHMMFHPDDDEPCPMCDMWADGYNAIAPHVNDKVTFVLVAKAEITKLRAWGKSRGWNRIRLLSSHDNTFNKDYWMEEEDGGQRPGVSVFKKAEDGVIYHSYITEMVFAPGHHRGIDLFTPVWNLLDLLPSGRENWMPSYWYPTLQPE